MAGKNKKKKGDDAQVMVAVSVVPTDGKTSDAGTFPVAVGTTVGDMLKQANVAAENKDVFLDGKPVTLDHPFPPETPKPHVLQVHERPAGS